MKCLECEAENSRDSSQCAACGVSFSDITGETVVDDTFSPQVSKTARGPKQAPTQKASPPAEPDGEAQTEFIPTDSTPTPRASSPSASGSSGLSRPRTAAGELAPSTIFGNRYEILGLVGEGGMG